MKNSIFLLLLASLGSGCARDSDRSTGTIPSYSAGQFRTIASDLIEQDRYRDAVEYLAQSDARQQADYDDKGFLAVGEDLIVLPGVHPDYEYDPDRDWCFPGTSDAIESESWQDAATKFASRYNKRRIGK